MLSSGMLVHEFHLSKSTINYNTKNAALEISVHIYIDDLEDALQYAGVNDLQIGTEKEDSLTDGYIADYISDHMILSTSNRDTLAQYFIGKEISKDLAAIWCYVEVPVDIPLSSLEIDNNILMEIFDDQKNIVGIKKNKKRVDDLFLKKSKHTYKVNF